MNYNQTKTYWDQVFKQFSKTDLVPETLHPTLHEGLSWLSEGCESILDYGCGHGKMLMLCQQLFDVKEGLGVDLSEEAVQLAKRIASLYELPTQFICGGIDYLKTIETNSVDGCILSNVLDNMIPKDAHQVLQEVKRIVKPDGKILVKLNPFLSNEQCETYGLKQIDDQFYQEDSGLYYWNLSNEEVETLLSNYFQIIKTMEVHYKEQCFINRLYLLANQ